MTSYARHDDVELVHLMRAGDRTGFAVLVDRTLPQVWQTASQGAGDVRGAVRATHATYVEALDGLMEGKPPADPAAWVVGLAEQRLSDATTAGGAPTLTMPVDLEDDLWRDLEQRWPGERRRARRGVAWTRLGVAVGLVLVAALLPVAFLGLPDAGSQPVAQPTRDSEPVERPEPDPTPDAPALPDFTFPTPPLAAEPEEPPTTFAPAEPEAVASTDPAPAVPPTADPEPQPPPTRPASSETVRPDPTGDPERSETSEPPDDDEPLPLPGDPSEEAADGGTEGEAGRA